jgi:hypothetical protein
MRHIHLQGRGDDDRGSCLLLKKLFTSLGYSCDITHSVSDALRAATCKSYCMALIDCLFPDQNGWTASQPMEQVLVKPFSKQPHLRLCLCVTRTSLNPNPSRATESRDDLFTELTRLQLFLHQGFFLL